MALRGNLKDFSLPDVFQLVTFSRKTGVLRITRENRDEGSVWFRDGEVFFAQSNWHTEPLGERLVRAQRLTPQALARALDLRAAEPEDGRRLGQILVDEGYLTDKVLEAFVSEQIQETIFDLMRWDEGEFDFEAMPDAVEEDIGLSVSIENIIMEGSRRLEEWARIRKKIPSMDVVFKMATAPGEGTFEISLKPTEWNLLLLVDGSRSVAELAHSTHRTDFEVARIIYGLFSAGLLEFASDEEVVRLRAERAERDAKLAVIEAERREKAEAASATVRAREAAMEAAAERRRAETQSVAPPADVAADLILIPAEPVEDPEFLGGGLSEPTAADAAALEEMMGAILGAAAHPGTQPGVVEEPPAPHVPVEEPAFMAVEHAEEVDLPLVPVPSVEDLLTDFPELRQSPESVEAAAAAVAEALAAVTPAPAVEPSPIEPAEGAGVIEPAIAPAVEAPPAEPVSAPEAMVEVESAVEPLPEVREETTPAESSPALEEPHATVAAEPVGEPIPGPSIEPSAQMASEVPAEPLLEQAAEAPVAEQPAPIEAEAPVADFERDLMALGLGELPADLGGQPPSLEQEPPEPLELAEAAQAASEVAWIAETDGGVGLEEAPEPLGGEAEAELAAISELADLAAPDIATPPAPEAIETEVPDFSQLLESLDIDAATTVAPSVEPEAGETEFEPLDFDEDILAEAAGESGGVISTDAFLEDITIEDVGFSGEMTDEISALTGATRPGRPQANVNRIPDAASGEVLRRDARVDRDTLLKIIDGIKNL